MRRFITALLVFLMHHAALAQPISSEINELNIPTPQAASFGKFGEIPVDHSTGIPNISVPIHNVIEGKLSVPISLRYHAGGLKLSEIPGWVGAGWNLNTGGIVSRVVQGLGDDSPGGYYYNGSSLNANNAIHASQVLRGERDGESDIYSYSIPGYSGKFYIEFDGQTQVIKQMPRADVKIEISAFQGIKFRQFTITDPGGTRYIFGYYNDNGNARTATESVETDVEDATRHIASWLLVRVETHDRLFHIDYHYTSDDFDYEHPHTCSIILTDTPMECDPNPPSQTCDLTTITFDNQGYALSQIVTSTETIDFFGNHSGLDSIRINTGSFCKKWVFGYDTSIFGSRLTLKTLQQSGCTGPSIPPYQFRYSPSPTVGRFSNMIDHWGYYNGESDNDNIPSTTINIPSTVVQGVTKGQSNRNTRDTAMLSGVLDTIIYPTGGSTLFEYEANDMKSTVLSPPTQVLSLVTTEPPNYDCQNTLTDDGQHAILSQAEVDNSSIEFGLSPDHCIGMVPEEGFLISITLEKFIISVWTNVGYVETFTPQTSPTVFSVPFTDLNTTGFALTPGIYRFTLTTEGSGGYCKLFSSTSMPDNVDVGGLRVKKITTKDGMTSHDIVKEYTYTDPSDPPYSSAKLLRMPLYGAYVFGIKVTPSDAIQSHDFRIFREDNIIPLSTLEGYHLFYTDVVESINGGTHGTIRYRFDQEATPLSGNFPIEPGDLAVRRGKLLSSQALSSTNSTVQSSTIMPLTPVYEDSPDFLKPFVANTYGTCNASGTFYVGALNRYNLRSASYQVTQKIDTLDGVVTESRYDYDGAGRFVSPVRSSITNSDGSVYHTEYTYPHDVTGTVYTNMVTLNMITPVITTQKVGSDPGTATVVDKLTTNYNLFLTGEGFYPYPATYTRDEVTWENGGTTPTSLTNVLQTTIADYDDDTGLPLFITVDGWNAMGITWNDNGTKASETYIDFTKSYTYHPGTKLIDTIANVDSTSTSFTYDQLCRLKTSTEICKGVTTTMDYFYSAPGSGGNYIRTITDYPPNNTNSALDIILNKQYFDGLGRPIQLIRENQGPTGTQDVVTAIEYDNRGLILHEYEPTLITNGEFQNYPSLTGGMSTNTYHPDPLSRAASTTHSAFNHPVQIDYDKNTVAIHGIGANQLFKVTTKDGDNKESITYRDKLGRTVATQQAGPNGASPLSTLYSYDDKHRQTEVIPPGAAAGNTNLNFEYEYYGNDLIKYKTMPDQDRIEYRYNNKDLMIHYQDGYLRRQPSLKWMAYNYDNYGRQTKSGFRSSAFVNNFPSNPAIGLSNELSETTYFTTGAHLDKPEFYDWRILLPDGTLGDQRQTQYNYDGCGRMVLNRSSTILSLDNTAGSRNHNRHEYSYDGADNMTFDDHQQFAFGLWTYTDQTRTVDHAGRQEEYQQRFEYVTDMGTQTISKNTYNQWDQLATHQLGLITGNTYLQTCDYTYLGNSWLAGINATMSTTDLFGLELHYDQISAGSSGQVQNNGNIAEVISKTKDRTPVLQAFRYDDYNRLSHSYSYDVNGTSLINANRYATTHGYDSRGNLSAITRQGRYPNGNTFSTAQIDNLAIAPKPNSNKINTVIDNAPAASKSYGAKGSADAFVYDNDGTNMGNGNLTFDPTIGATITYNHLNLPRLISFDHGGTIEFTYDADGNQLRKTVKQGSTVIEDRYYIGAAEYKDGALVQVMHDEGRIARRTPCDQNQYFDGIQADTDTYTGDHILSTSSVVPTGTTTYKADEAIILGENFSVQSGKVYEAFIEPCSPGNWQYEYALKDHLGNTRVLFTADGSTTKTLQEEFYYPFGLNLLGDWNENPKQDFNYKYNSKEIHQDFNLDWYNYGARCYDAKIGRFTSIDRFAEKYSFQSPYTYAANDPIKFIDVNGDSIWIAYNGTNILYDNGDLYNSDGTAYEGKVRGGLKKVVKALEKIGSSKYGKDLLNTLSESENNVIIKHSNKAYSRFAADIGGARTAVLSNNSYALQVLDQGQKVLSFLSFDEIGSGGDVIWNPSQGGYLGLAHELGHAYDANFGFLDSRRVDINGSKEEIREIRAVYHTNRIRLDLGKKLRRNYNSGATLLDSNGNPMNYLPPYLQRFIFPNLKADE